MKNRFSRVLGFLGGRTLWPCPKLWRGGLALGMAGFSPAHAQLPNLNLDFLAPKELPEQWWTGPLYSPGPAFPSGMWSVGSYYMGGLPTGKFGPHGGVEKGSSAKTFSNLIWAKAAITNNLTMQIQPTWSYTTRSQTNPSSSGFQFNDLPVDFMYRLTPHYSPAVGFSLGFLAPAGNYSNLRNSASGVGSGAWYIRSGFQSQFIAPFFRRSMRIRVWGYGSTPTQSVRLKNQSSYGTPDGFRGSAHPASFGSEGAAFEFGITRRLEFTMDLYHTWAQGTRTRGWVMPRGALGQGPGYGNLMTVSSYDGKPARIDSKTHFAETWNAVPGVGYSFDPNWCIIFGVGVPMAGHHAARTFWPQFSFFYSG